MLSRTWLTELRTAVAAAVDKARREVRAKELARLMAGHHWSDETLRAAIERALARVGGGR